MSSEYWREKRKTMELKNYSNKSWLETPKFGNRHNPADSWNWVNPKQGKPKESHTKTPQTQTSDNWRQNLLKSLREKWHLTYRENQYEWQISYKKPRGPKGSVTVFLKYLSTQNPISGKNNILQERKGNQDILRWKKTKGIFCRQTYPQRMAKGKFSRHRENDWRRNLGTLGRKKDHKPVFYFAAHLEGKGP